MAKAGFTGNKFKYSELELRNRGVSKFIDSRDQAWKIKKATYANEGVWGSFTSLRDCFRALLREADGISYTEIAHRSAEIMMDAFLIRRARGENVEVPAEVSVARAIPDGGDSLELIDSENFDGKVVSENEKLRWIFENMQVEGISPENAPSPGTYSLLLELRKDNEQRRDFYKTLWPKLLTKEDIEKGGKLQDDGKDVLDLIKRLQAALPKEV